MDQSRMAEWLNRVFSEFDYKILSSLHYFTEKTNGVFTDDFEIISLLSEKGLLLLFTGIVLFCFSRTRKIGFCISAAVCFSAFITLILKDFIARPRPFVDTAAPYYYWWISIGSPAETGFAFPSGHTTVAMAASSALFLVINYKFRWLSFLFVIITGISRCCLMVHYPSDILGGIIIGATGSALACFIYPQFISLLNWINPKRCMREKMKLYKKYLIIILSVFISMPLTAKEADAEELQYFRLDLFNDSLILGGGLLLNVGNKAVDKLKRLSGGWSLDTDPDIKRVNFLDRQCAFPYSNKLDKASDILTYSALLSPVILLSLPDTEWFTVGTMYAESVIWAWGLKELGKNIIQRKRPYMYFDDYPEDEIKTGDLRIHSLPDIRLLLLQVQDFVLLYSTDIMMTLHGKCQ